MSDISHISHTRLFHSPNIIYISLCIPLLLCFPSLFVGLVGDDYFHKAVLTNTLPYPSNPLMDLFAFFQGEATNPFLIDIGVLSWWSEPDIQASFMRPISALSHIIDYILWPNHIVMHHLHSIIWMTACIWMAYQVFRLILPKETGILYLCILIFAVEDAHVMATSWIANRNACIAFFFSMLCLKHHILWSEGKDLSKYNSQCFFVLALLSGESGICVWGYLLAYNIIFLPFQLQSLSKYLPYVIWIGLWRILYRSLGFGTFGSGLYIDPLQSPMLFLQELLYRGPLLFSSLYLQFPAEIGIFIPPTAQLFVQIFCIAFFLFCVYQVYRKKNKIFTFCFFGSILSIIPLCGAFPMERLLLFPSFGFAILVSQFVFEHSNFLSKMVLFFHLPIACVLHVVKGLNLFLLKHMFSIGYNGIPQNIQPQQNIFFVNGMELPCAYTTILSFDSNIQFQGISMLSSSTKTATLTKINDTDFILSYTSGMFEGTFDRMTINDNHIFEPKSTIQRKNFEVTILETIEGEPSRVQFHVPKGIEHPDFIWLVQQGFEFVPFSFPSDDQPIIIEPFFFYL